MHGIAIIWLSHSDSSLIPDSVLLTHPLYHIDDGVQKMLLSSMDFSYSFLSLHPHSYCLSQFFFVALLGSRNFLLFPGLPPGCPPHWYQSSVSEMQNWILSVPCSGCLSGLLSFLDPCPTTWPLLTDSSYIFKAWQACLLNSVTLHMPCPPLEWLLLVPFSLSRFSLGIISSEAVSTFLVHNHLGLCACRIKHFFFSIRYLEDWALPFLVL